MKKIVLSIFTLLSLPFFAANAQVNVTFQVNITDYLAGGGVINNIVSIAGNFTTSGGDLPDWTPAGAPHGHPRVRRTPAAACEG